MIDSLNWAKGLDGGPADSGSRQISDDGRSAGLAVDGGATNWQAPSSIRKPACSTSARHDPHSMYYLTDRTIIRELGRLDTSVGNDGNAP
jgi:hypothetical protein